MKYSNSWHLLRDDEVQRELSTDMYTGLSSSEVKRRRHRFGTNDVWKVKRRSAWDIVSSILFDLPTLLLVLSAAVAALFDKKYEAGAIVVILIVSGILRAITYFRANRIFEDTAHEKIPVSAAIRDGTISLIPASDIVLGDIVFLEAGDTVPCDGRVLSGDEATVSERGITENKTAVQKFNTVIRTKSESGEIPCEFRSNMVFAGSKVLAGAMRIVAVSTGSNTLISMQRGGIEITPAENIPIVENLRSRSKATSLIMLGCVLVVSVISLFTGDHNLSEVFLSAMAMAVAAMSEFLTGISYIIAAITLRDAADGKTDGVVDFKAASKIRKKKLSERSSASRIVIRNPEKIETIAVPDIAVFCGAQYFKSGKAELYAYRAGGEYYSNERLASEGKSTNPALSALLNYAAAATYSLGSGMTAEGETRRTAENSVLVSRAVDAYNRMTGESLKTDYSIYDHCSPGERRAIAIDSSIIYQNESNKIVICGAIDDVIRASTTIDDGKTVRQLTDDDRKTIFTECATLEFGGARVLAVASKKAEALVVDPLAVRSGMTFIGYFALTQEPEAETNSLLKTNIEFIKKAGIVPVLFTERPDNDLYYCHRFGLFNKNTVRIIASELEKLDMSTLNSDGLIVSFSNLGGVYLTNAFDMAIKILKGVSDSNPEGDRKVVSLGMEIWDCGALKSSDIGIAVARSDYQSIPQILSRQASVVVYPEEGKTENGYGGFSGFVRAIKYARRAIENIDSAKIYITASQCTRLLLIIASLFTDIPIMNAVFILVWGLLFDFITALVMAFENNGREDGYIRKRFARDNDGYDESEKKAIKERNTTVFAVTLGLIWGLIITSSAPLLKLFALILNYEYTKGLVECVIAAAVVMSGLVLALEIMKRSSIFVSHNPNGAQLAYIVVSLILALAAILSYVAAIASPLLALIKAMVSVLIPGVLMLVICEVARVIEKNKNK